jgi:putative hydrolase of the HAD superfamily
VRYVPVAAVAFDMGGVLTEPPFAGLEDYARCLGLPEDTFIGYFRADAMMARLETGDITSREFFKYVCVSCQSRHDVRVDIHRLADAAQQGERLSTEALDLVGEVRQWARTALLTNNVESAGWRRDFPFGLFDAVIDSSSVGVRKPDPAIYRLLVEALAVEPFDIAFFDDLEENIEPARQLGIQAFMFTTVEGCRAKLAELGLLGLGA